MTNEEAPSRALSVITVWVFRRPSSFPLCHCISRSSQNEPSARALRSSDFVIPSSFVIRASSFLASNAQKTRPVFPSSNSECAKLFERHLAFDFGRRGDRAVDKSRATISEQNAGDCAKFADAHRAYGEIEIFLCDEIEQSRELRWCVGARCNFENICAERFRPARFELQITQIGCCFEVMKRNDSPNIFLSR